MSQEPLWQPSAGRAAATRMHEFLHAMAKAHGFAPGWEALRAWSIERPDSFWPSLLNFVSIEPSAPATAPFHGAGMLDTRWFPGMTLNYARHMLRDADDSDAILFDNERGFAARLSRRELHDAVARCAAALRRDGVARGDRVAGYMPNVPETIIAMLATASLGAIWSSCSPDFGVNAVLDRFGQIEPKVLIVPDQYSYGGKWFPMRARVTEILQKLPSVRRVVITRYPESEGETAAQAIADSKAAGREISAWSDYLRERDPPPSLTFEELPFDHPLFIMFSSGTTGVPKCIVHGHGGTLLQHMKELMLHSDVRPGDRLFYFTTCGWMMWNWLASGLGAKAAIVLFDGNPMHPFADRLWEMAAARRVTHFGTSPKFLGACQKARLEPGRQHDLAALRCVLSTGSPLSDELFRWTYESVKPDLQLASISGGTDIISCFMLGNPLLPVYAGEIQCRGLGLDVQAWDESGRPVIGRKGELVCCTPFPCQPVSFWNDPDGRKYRSAYFDFFTPEAHPDHPLLCERGPIWRHGDFVEITQTGGVIVYGRSDATLNPGGVRIGTAEIYRIVESLPEILDSIVVGRNTADQDVQIALFIVLRPGHTLTPDLEKKIRTAIAEGASKRHVPKFIRQVSAIPVTVSGKKTELAVQQMLHGEEVKNRDALANPEALNQFAGILD